jgi:hypothetical protein
MIVRRLFALLFAVTMSLAPLGMPAMAEAPTPASHHGAMAKNGHCDQQPQPTQHHKASDKGCCAGDVRCHGGPYRRCRASILPCGSRAPGIGQ